MEKGLKIKVCGMKHLDNIAALAALKPDFMGLIFYPKSKRFVEDLDPVQTIALTEGIERVGVFVNASLEEILKEAQKFQLSHLQLHGDESPELCKTLKEKGYKIIKVFGIGQNFDFDLLNPYKPFVDYFLFDTKGKERGGNGYAFDWDLLREYDNEKPLFLSGGLSVENIDQVKELRGLLIHTLDINSKFEREPGIKDIELLKRADFDKIRNFITYE